MTYKYDITKYQYIYTDNSSSMYRPYTTSMKWEDAALAGLRLKLDGTITGSTKVPSTQSQEVKIMSTKFNSTPDVLVAAQRAQAVAAAKQSLTTNQEAARALHALHTDLTALAVKHTTPDVSHYITEALGNVAYAGRDREERIVRNKRDLERAEQLAAGGAPETGEDLF